jgi:hypothetical protein
MDQVSNDLGEGSAGYRKQIRDVDANKNPNWADRVPADLQLVFNLWRKGGGEGMD